MPEPHSVVPPSAFGRETGARWRYRVEMQEARASERVTNPRRVSRRRLRRRVAVVVVVVGVRHRPGRRVWTYLKSGWMGAVFSRKRERPGEGGGDVGLVSLNLHHRVHLGRPQRNLLPLPRVRSAGWEGEREVGGRRGGRGEAMHSPRRLYIGRAFYK